MTGLRRRPWWGMRTGLGLGVVLMLFHGVRAGSFGFPGEVVALYLIAGALGGALFGFCLPFAQTRPGAALVGVVALTPYFALFGALDAYVTGEGAIEWWAYGIAGILVGALTGYAIRDTFHRDLDDQC